MSSILNFIKNLPEICTSGDNITNDINYIRKSSVLVNEALQKGAYIMQMTNGDVHVTETKVVTYKYEWNKEKGRFERASSASRTKKKRMKAGNQNKVEKEVKILERIA